MDVVNDFSKGANGFTGVAGIGNSGVLGLSGSTWYPPIEYHKKPNKMTELQRMAAMLSNNGKKVIIDTSGNGITPEQVNSVDYIYIRPPFTEENIIKTVSNSLANTDALRKFKDACKNECVEILIR